jgi:hypothetical protein
MPYKGRPTVLLSLGSTRSRTRESLGVRLRVPWGRCVRNCIHLTGGDGFFHILFKSGAQGISAVMRKLLTWYAQYYNRRHRRTGHLFENRYKSILCDEDNYFLALIRYIHLNPVRARLVTTISELDCYPWGGHSAIMEKTRHRWIARMY